MSSDSVSPLWLVEFNKNKKCFARLLETLELDFRLSNVSPRVKIVAVLPDSNGGESLSNAHRQNAFRTKILEVIRSLDYQDTFQDVYIVLSRKREQGLISAIRIMIAAKLYFFQKRNIFGSDKAVDYIYFNRPRHCGLVAFDKSSMSKVLDIQTQSLPRSSSARARRLPPSTSATTASRSDLFTEVENPTSDDDVSSYSSVSRSIANQSPERTDGEDIADSTMRNDVGEGVISQPTAEADKKSKKFQSPSIARAAAEIEVYQQELSKIVDSGELDDQRFLEPSQLLSESGYFSEVQNSHKKVAGALEIVTDALNSDFSLKVKEEGLDAFKKHAAILQNLLQKPTLFLSKEDKMNTRETVEVKEGMEAMDGKIEGEEKGADGVEPGTGLPEGESREVFVENKLGGDKANEAGENGNEAKDGTECQAEARNEHVEDVEECGTGVEEVGGESGRELIITQELGAQEERVERVNAMDGEGFAEGKDDIVTLKRSELASMVQVQQTLFERFEKMAAEVDGLRKASAALALAAHASLTCANDSCKKQELARFEMRELAGRIEESIKKRRKEEFNREEMFLQRLRCPITLEIMQDPVVAGDGHTYERSAINAWLKDHSTSPVTNLPMPATLLRENISLKAMIMEWKDWVVCETSTLPAP